MSSKQPANVQGSSAQASSLDNEIFEVTTIVTATSGDRRPRIFEYSFDREGLHPFPVTYTSSQQGQMEQYHQILEHVNQELGAVIPIAGHNNRRSDFLIARSTVRMGDEETTKAHVYLNVTIAIQNVLSNAEGNSNTIMTLCFRHPKLRHGPVYMDNVTHWNLKIDDIFKKLDFIQNESRSFKIDRELQIEVEILHKNVKKHVVGAPNVAKAFVIAMSYTWKNEQSKENLKQEPYQEKAAKELCHHLKCKPDNTLNFIETFARKQPETRIVIVSKDKTQVFNDTQQHTLRLLEIDGVYDAILPTDY